MKIFKEPLDTKAMADYVISLQKQGLNPVTLMTNSGAAIIFKSLSEATSHTNRK